MTQGDVFVVTGPNSVVKLNSTLARVYPINPKIISQGSTASITSLNRRVRQGKGGAMHPRGPMHMDVLVEEIGLENAVDDTHSEKLEPLPQSRSN